jgi:membrane protein DedA with SNARE-associated domain
MAVWLSLFFGTFVSEDLSCITAGLLVQRGDVGVASVTTACALGIFASDLALWSVGRLFGRAVLAWPRLAKRLQESRGPALQAWLGRHAAGAIVGSRFLPGTRLPLYLIAGFTRLPVMVFAVWALVGAALWTPTLVLLTASLGDAFIARLAPIVGAGWLVRIAAGAVILGLLWVIRSLAMSARGSQAASAV